MPLSIADLVPPTRFKAALIDFDGTIAISHHVWNEVDHIFLERRGIPYTDDLASELAALGFAEGALYVIDRYGLDERPEDICDEWNELGAELYATEVDLRPGAKAHIDALRAAGVKCALVTTNDRDVLANLKPRVDVDALFDEQVYGAEVGVPKTRPDMYLEAARRLGVEPSDCVVFEDIPQGLASAKVAGMTAVGVLSGDPTQDPKAIAAAADFVLDGWTRPELLAPTD